MIRWGGRPFVPEYRQLLRDSRIGEAAAALTRSPTVRLFHDHLLVKEPGTVQETPWLVLSLLVHLLVLACHFDDPTSMLIPLPPAAAAVGGRDTPRAVQAHAGTSD